MKIVVIDSGVSVAQSKQPYMCKNGVLSVMDSAIDDHGHGTNIVGIIGKKLNHKKYCIVSIRFWTKLPTPGYMTLNRLISAMNIAKSLKPYIVNLSLNGPTADETEFQLVQGLLEDGAMVNVAAGNEGAVQNSMECNAFPACYKYRLTSNLRKNFKVISAYNVLKANTGELVDLYTNGYKLGFPAMSGTSQATAVFTSTIATP